MNLEQINSLLEYIDKQISQLEENIDKVLLKNTLENLRSALDYCAMDISRISNNDDRKIYFPYGQRKNHFNKSINRSFPNLRETHSEIYELIESLQPYKCDDQWLINLCDLTNEAKHNNLNKTENISKVKSISGAGVHFENPRRLIISNNTFNGKGTEHIEVEKGEVINKIAGAFNFRIIEENKIFFSNKEIEILPFLKNTVLRIKSFIEHTYLQINS